MSKLAIFVEGLTEQLFVERLITEIAGIHNIRIRVEQAKGKRGDRRITFVSEQPDVGQPGYILIVNCRGDHNVASDVRDQYDSLSRSNFKAIIGLRDLYPRPRTDLPILLGLDRRSLNFGLKTNPIKVQWIIAIVEVEAWFLAEHTHFSRLHPSLSADRILLELGFDPRTDDMETRSSPAMDLQSIYNLAGLTYLKTPAELARTVNALDIVHIYTDMEHVIQLRKLVDALDNFVANCVTA